MIVSFKDKGTEDIFDGNVLKEEEAELKTIRQFNSSEAKA